MPRWVKIALGALAGVLVLAVAGVVVLTQTDYGRARVRSIVVSGLRSSAHGLVRVGPIRGNLLTGATIVGLVITDSTGAPFFRADTISLRYSLLALLRQRVDVSGVRLVHPVVVLDRPPGLAWNFARIFPSDTTRPPERQGFGAWVAVRDLEVERGRVTVRNEWLPPDSLAGAERDSVIREALSPESRQWVVRVPGGFQSVQDYRELDGRFSRLRLTNPDSAAMVFDIARLSAVALPFRPPAAEIRDVSGRVISSGDTVIAERLEVVLPGSRLTLDGTYDIGNGDTRATAVAGPLALADLRWVYPSIPEGSGTLDASVERRGERTRVTARQLALAVETARAGGSFDVTFGDTLRLGPTDVQFSGVGTRLIQRLAPTMSVPRHGTLNGRLALAGTEAALRVDGNVAFVDEAGATSRLLADGEVGTEGGFRAEELRVRLAPVQLALVSAAGPSLPVGGAVTGEAVLTGTARDGFAFRADLVHQAAEVGRSHVTAAGAVLRRGETFAARDLRVRLDPVQVAVARAFNPDLPLTGTVVGTTTLNGTPEELRLTADLVHVSAETGRSRLLAEGGVGMGETFRARDLRLRFEPLQVALARAFNPDLALGGTVAGTARLSGTPADLRVDADLTHESAGAGRSRVLANGYVGFGDAFRARELRLRFEPVQTAMLRAFSPDLPVDGLLAGRATVNGSTAGRMVLEGDVTHEGSTGPSRVVGSASLPLAGQGQVAVDVRALPLSLETAGLFAPSAGLRGNASGGVRLTGTMRDLALSLGLTVQDGGTLEADGRLDLASAEKSYDVRARFGAFDASAVTSRAPASSLTGTASAVGRGTDPATMAAAVEADLTGARVGTVGLDTVRLVSRVADGLAEVERGIVRLASAAADVRGSLGLVAGRSGTLDYRVRVDSLADLSGFVPPDTTVVPPRPAEIARAVARARADSARIARATEVERAATGLPAEPTLQVDSIPPLPRDSLAGSLTAEGTLAGNVTRFDVRGSAAVRSLLALGNAVGSGTVRYQWLNAPTATSDLSLDAELDSVVAGGFALDSVGGQVRYAGGPATGSGTLNVAVRQDERRDYRARADFSLSPERREVRYSELTLRFDTTVWRAARPGAIRLAGGGVELEDVELRASDGGSIAADGRIPGEGPAELRVAIDRLEIGDVVALLQDSLRVRGRLSLAADVRGTGAAPVITATAGLAGLVVDTVRVPDLDARFDYAGRQLRGDARLTRDGRVLLSADGLLPVDLAVSGVTGPRLAADAPLELDVRADSLPLEALPSFTDAVSDVRGRLVGNVAVRGTRASPDIRGRVNLDLGSLRLVQAGVLLEDVAGAVSVTGDTAVIDSLTAVSAGGTIRLAGSLDLATPAQPGFDLRLQAERARVLDNEMGRVRANADLTMTGPWTAARIGGSARLVSGEIKAPEAEELQRIDIDRPSVAALGDTAALAIVTANPLLANLRVDVDVSIARDTWVRNSQANVEIFTPPDATTLRVTLDRAAQTLTLEGTVNAERGEYTFAGRRIRLTQGSVVFLGETPINPILQLTAEQQVRLPNRPAFSIQLLVGGTLRAPALTIASNAQPPIPESDLLSYFAFGESSSSLLQSETGGSIGGGTGGGGAPLGALGGLATQQLGATAVGAVVDQLERQTSNSLQLDVFNVTPAPLPPEMAVQGYVNVFRGAQFEAGRYVTNRWFVAAQGRTAAVIPGLLVEYRTPSGFSWVSSWEPRFLTQQPSLTIAQDPISTNVLGFFLQAQRRF